MFYLLRASGAGGAVESFGGKPLHFPPTQLPGHDGALVLLELQQGLEDGRVIFKYPSVNIEVEQNKIGGKNRKGTCSDLVVISLMVL